MKERELIIEFFPIGNSVKVSVMDPETLTEVSIVGPRAAPKGELQKTAIRKLQYVMDKKRESATEPKTGSVGKKKGIIV
jgi:hypothetical protein